MLHFVAKQHYHTEPMIVIVFTDIYQGWWRIVLNDKTKRISLLAQDVQRKELSLKTEKTWWHGRLHKKDSQTHQMKTRGAGICLLSKKLFIKLTVVPGLQGDFPRKKSRHLFTKQPMYDEIYRVLSRSRSWADLESQSHPFWLVSF